MISLPGAQNANVKGMEGYTTILLLLNRYFTYNTLFFFLLFLDFPAEHVQQLLNNYTSREKIYAKWIN